MVLILAKFLGGFRFLAISIVILLGVQVKVAWSQATPSIALPSGSQIKAGGAHIDISGANMLINQSSQRAVIDWRSFNVGKDASIHFNQPNSAAATLNRITGANPSQILGRIQAPGQVFISNGNGVYFGRSASVDVGSLVATTMDIDIEDFMKGQLRFLQGKGSGEVVNEGELRAKFEGFIALLAPDVRNQGLIFAEKGTVALASGEMVELELDPYGKLSGIRVTPGEWEALVENNSAIEAEEGLVILSAQAVRSLRGGLIRNTGSIKATGMKRVGGRLILTSGENGTVENAGLLDVSSIHGKGGRVTLEGEAIILETDSVIDATGSIGGGEVLIGGDWQGGTNDELRIFDDPDAIIQAEIVFMAEGARIDASASSNGDGGKVVLWSDVLNPNSFTTVLGEIYAQGGSKQGDGGMVETSGRILNINQAKVSTIATAGSTGLWLLDPGNINITDSGTSDTDSLPSFPVGIDTDIHPTSIVNALGSSNVSIQTGSGNYDLTINSAISYSGSNNLTLEAGQDVLINAAVDIDSGDLTITSGRDLSVGANLTSATFSATVGQDAIVSNSINSGAGTLTINADNDISLAANLTTTNTTNSAILLNAGKNDSAGSSSGGDISISGSPSISVGGSGQAIFYTGSITGSTGLTTLIGWGTGRFRYYSDESASNYTTAISSGKYAVYREQPASSIVLSDTTLTYGSATPTISTDNLQNGDTLTASIEDESYTDHGSDETKYLDVKGEVDAASGDFQVQSYSISENLSALGYNVTNNQTITVNQKQVTLSATKTYDGNNVLNGSEVTIGNLITNEAIGYSGATVRNKHVMADATYRYINAITLTNGTIQSPAINVGSATKSRNYKLPTLTRSNAPVTTNVATLSVSVNNGSHASPSAGLTKTYDGFDSAADDFSPEYTFTGLVSGDASAELSFSDANYNSGSVADASSLTMSGITINNISGSKNSYPTDYVLESTTETVDASINKAVLTVTANSSFKFISESDPSGFSGVTYSGFVNYENLSVLTGSATLSRADSTNDTAGDYALIPDVTGITVANYSLSTANGVFTIVPANELKVVLNDAVSTYGDALPAYTISSISYYDGSIIQTVDDSFYVMEAISNKLTVSDSLGDDVNVLIFKLGPPSGNNSSSGDLKVGTYKLGASEIDNSGSFSSTVVVNGTHTVDTLTLTLSPSHVSAGKTKIYDGTPDMEGLQYDLSSLIKSGDTVNVSGLGTYRNADETTNKDVEYSGTTDVGHTITYNVTDKNYRIENVILSGSDSSNYLLSSNAIDGTDGRINQRQILYIPAKKTYDGNNYISRYVVPETGSPYYTAPVVEGEILIVDPDDSSNEAAGVAAASGGLINNEDFSYVTNHAEHAGTISSKHVTGPDDHKETYIFEHDDSDSDTTDRTDNFITKIVLGDDAGGSEFEPQNYSLPTLNAANAPFKVIPKQLTITGTRVYDSEVNWPESGDVEDLTVTTEITGETLQYSNASTASEHAGTVTDGVRSMTYISAIALQDAADAVRQTSGSYNASGFITDYKFSNKDLWDTSDADHTNISISSISNTATYNDVTITPKPITISGIEVDDKIYDGGLSANEYFSPVNTNLVSLGKISGDNFSISTVTGTFENKNVSLSGSTVEDKTVNLVTNYTGDDVYNYSITDQATAQAKIYPRPIGFSGEKTYDGTTTLNNDNVTSGGLSGINGFADSGLESGESLIFSVTSSDKNVATSSKYATNTALGLADSGSYLASNYTTTAYNFTLISDGSTINVPGIPSSYDVNDNKVIINEREVYLLATKVYDGTTTIDDDQLTALDSDESASVNLVSGEDLTFSGSLTSSTKNVDDATYLVTSSITLLDGSTGIASNYTKPANSYNATKNNVTITTKALQIKNLTLESADKIYDGNAVAAIVGTATLEDTIAGSSSVDSDKRPITGDTISLNLSEQSASFPGSNVSDSGGVAQNQTVSYSGITLAGGDATNYTLDGHSDDEFKINKRPLSLIAEKTYNGLTDLSPSLLTSGGLGAISGNADSGLVSSQTLGFSATLATKDVNGPDGNSGTVDNYVSSITLSDGSNGGIGTNYYLSSSNSHSSTENSFTVNKRGLSITATKIYDGTNVIETSEVILGNRQNSETLTVDAGVTASSIDRGGNPYVDNISISSGTSGTVGDPDNYQLPSLSSYSATDNALTITQKPLTIVDGTLESADKFYDGDNTATPSGTPSLQSFVTTGSNADNDNRPVSIGGTDDDVSISYTTITATFDSADVTYDAGGNVIDQTVTYAGMTLSGGKSDNYSLNTHTDSYRINTREVDLSATKIYDDSLAFDPSSADDVLTITASTGENLTFSSAAVAYKNQWEANNFFTSIVLADGDTGSNDGIASNYVLPPMSYDAVRNSVTITPRDVTITANSVSKTYGDAVTFDGTEFTEAGLQGDDAITISFASGGAVDTTNVNSYAIVPSAATDSGSTGFDTRNYNINYVNGTLTVNRKALSISGLTASDKIYDGTDDASISSYGSLSGVLFSDDVSLNSGSLSADSANFSDKNVALDGSGNEIVKTVTLSLTNSDLTGAKSGNYSITNQTTNNAKILKRELTLSAIKVFDGTRVIESGEITLGNYATLGGAEELVISNANSMDSSADNLSSINVNSSSKFIDTSASTSLGDEAGATSASGGLAANYKLPPIAYDSAKNNLTITAAPLIILADDQSKTYGDADPTLTVSYSGDATGFDPSHISGWTISAPTNASATAGTHSITIDVSAATADNDNYTFASPTSGTFTVNKRPITLKAQDQSKTYGDVLSLGTTAFDLTTGSFAPYASGVHTSEAATAVTLTSANGYAASTKQNQATYSDEIVIQLGSVTGDNFDTNNYQITRDEGDLTINKREVTLSVTKSYDGTAIVETSELIIGNRANGETLSTTGVLTANSKNVDGTNFVVTTTNFLADGTGLASNYQLPSSSYVSAVNSVTTTPIALTITADDQSKTYGDANPILSVDYTGLVGNDALSPSSEISGLSVSAPTGASAGYVTHVITVSGATATYGNYNITQNNGTLTVNQRPITLTATNQSKTYGDVDSLGNTSFSLTSGTYAPSEEATDVVLTTGASAYESTATANAGTYSGAIDISGATGSGGFLESNYLVTYLDGDYVINPAALTITADDLSKIYGYAEPVRTATYTGFQNSENESVVSGLVLSAPTGASATVGDHAITAAGATSPNYLITHVPRVLSVSKAVLTVTASNDSKFVTQADPAGFQGVTYSGFHYGEQETDPGLIGGTLAITRTNVSTDVADTYEDVLLPSGLTASNYSFQYEEGDFTIVPSDQLLVRLDNVVNTYGTATSYTIGSVEYYNGAAVVRLDDGSVPGSSVSINASNQVSLNDGSGGTASFDVGPLSGAYSSANKLEQGSYTLGSIGEATENSENFSDTITIVGSHQVNTKNLTASASAGLSKIYDSTVNMTGLSLTLSGIESGDIVTAEGLGSYSTQNVGTGLSYTLSDMSLSGTDSNNYYLTLGYTTTATNGEIVAKTVGLAASRIYDGAVDLSGTDVTISTGVGSETLTYTGASSSYKDVAVANKYIDAITLTDATDGSGGLASNYQLPSLDSTNAPVTINTKTVGLSAERIYDGTEDLLGSDVIITTGVGVETLTHTGTTSSSKDVALANKYINAITLTDASDGSGGLASNYNLPTLDSSLAPVSIKAKTVGLVANRIYDGTVDFMGNDVTITTGVGSETLTHTGTTANSKDVAVEDKYIDAITLTDTTDGSGGLASNYQLPSLDVLNAPVTINAKTVGLISDRIYDGTVDLLGSDVIITTGVGVETLTHTGTTSSSKDVAVANKYIDAITLTDATDGSSGLVSNYQLPSLDSTNAPVTINTKTVGLSADRIYDGTVDLLGSDVTITTGVVGESLTH
ncbi:MAG: YDG domain-containing protein, partial [Opitutales bacterium]|nr:YDG domain-containing protein [Opitutales bacterium]